MLQITRTKVQHDANALEAWRREFAERHVVYIEDFLAPDVLAEIQRRLTDSAFELSTHTSTASEVIGQEARLDPDSAAARMLWLLLNRSQLYACVRQISGCPPIGCFLGRGYRMAPVAEHFDDWHDDLADERMVGLSIELGDTPYEGGEFELRDRRTKTVHARVENKKPGSVHLFRIDAKLEHRVGRLRGTVPRTACAGWFCRTPIFKDAFLGALLPSKAGTATTGHN